jgi:hypothetical protein
MKQIGLGLHQFASARRDRFPAANDRLTTGTATTATAKVATSGYSWIFHILPYFEETALYDRVKNVANSGLGQFSALPLSTQVTTGTNPWTNVQLAGLICPSWGGDPILSTNNNYGATCYKAMAGRGTVVGTTVVPLTATGTAATGPYASDDGYLTLAPTGPVSTAASGTGAPNYPIFGRNLTSGDGTSKTILVAESKEGNSRPGSTTTQNSAWFLGLQTWVVANLPSAGSPPLVNQTYAVTSSGLNFGPTAQNPSQQYASSIFVGSGATAVTMNWGPSSDHAGNLVMHAMGDGSIRSIAADVDAAVYLMLSTFNGGENTPSDF